MSSFCKERPGLGGHPDQGVEGRRVLGVLLGQLEEPRGEPLRLRVLLEGLLAVRIGLGGLVALDEVLIGRLVLLDQRLVLRR